MRAASRDGLFDLWVRLIGWRIDLALGHAHQCIPGCALRGAHPVARVAAVVRDACSRGALAGARPPPAAPWQRDGTAPPGVVLHRVAARAGAIQCRHDCAVHRVDAKGGGRVSPSAVLKPATRDRVRWASSDDRAHQYPHQDVAQQLARRQVLQPLGEPGRAAALARRQHASQPVPEALPSGTLSGPVTPAPRARGRPAQASGPSRAAGRVAVSNSPSARASMRSSTPSASESFTRSRASAAPRPGQSSSSFAARMLRRRRGRAAGHDLASGVLRRIGGRGRPNPRRGCREQQGKGRRERHLTWARVCCGCCPSGPRSTEAAETRFQISATFAQFEVLVDRNHRRR